MSDTHLAYDQSTFAVGQRAVADTRSFALAERPRTLPQSYNRTNSKTNNNSLI